VATKETIIVEKGIPLPASEKSQPKQYPFGTMEVGDSFFSIVSKQTLWQYCSRQHKLDSSKKFTVRPEGRGSRVWRVA
jgi:hypothetical protein